MNELLALGRVDKCDVCGKHAPVFVRASGLIAASFAYCFDCLTARPAPEPYGAVVAVLYYTVTPGEQVATWLERSVNPDIVPVVMASCLLAGKTIQALHADCLAALNELDNYDFGG